MHSPSNIERQVMASVGVVYAARQLVSATALKLYVLAVAAYALLQLVWVHKVFENWAHVGLSGTWNFVSYAVLHTNLPVQIALILMAVMGLSLMRDAIRTLLRPRPSLLSPL